MKVIKHLCHTEIVDFFCLTKVCDFAYPNSSPKTIFEKMLKNCVCTGFHAGCITILIMPYKYTIYMM
jgi:hypothetical protein